MPSLLDHLAGDDETDLSPALPPDGLIDAVKADGVRRRTFRHRRNVGIALLGLAFLAVPLTALRSGDGGSKSEISVAATGDPTNSAETTEATVPLEPVEPLDPTAVTEPVTLPPVTPTDVVPPVTAAPVSVPPPATVATTTPPRPGPATTLTTAPACRNSDRPSCGDFRWDPAPSPNQPLVATFTKVPTNVVAGQPVEFEVSWSDADAKLTFDHFSTDGTSLVAACTLPPRFGPWTPPPANGGSGMRPYVTTFPSAGTYHVVVGLSTADCTSPYGNDRTVDVTVTVAAAPATG